MLKKKVSIIIPNWNGKRFLKMCLSSLDKLTYPNYEIVVVDNGSKDGSREYVKRYFPFVRLIENKENLGYAGGANLGIKNSFGDYVLILNNDVEVEPNFLTILVERLESSSKIACVQPKICTYDNREILDAVGSFLTSSGFLYHFGRLKKASLSQYNQVREIYSAKGAAMLLRRDVLDRIGLFDDDFFAYFEETDLCHRVWLAGYRVVYEPKAVIYHVVAGTSLKFFVGAPMLYFSLRNRICSFLKNYETFNLIKLLLITLLIYFGMSLVYLATFKFSLVLAVIKAVFWNFKNLPKTLKKRKFVQEKVRRISDEELFKKTMKNPPISYYFYLFFDRLGDFPGD